MLREIEIEIEGRKLKIRELSVMGRINLLSLLEEGKKITTNRIIEQCMGKEDFAYLSTIAGKEESKKIIDAVTDLNSKEETSFQAGSGK